MTPKQFYHFLACIAKSIKGFALSLAQTLLRKVNCGTLDVVNLECL
jgi:hypothetical protein